MDQTEFNARLAQYLNRRSAELWEEHGRRVDYFHDKPDTVGYSHFWDGGNPHGSHPDFQVDRDRLLITQAAKRVYDEVADSAERTKMLAALLSGLSPCLVTKKLDDLKNPRRAPPPPPPPDVYTRWLSQVERMTLRPYFLQKRTVDPLAPMDVVDLVIKKSIVGAAMPWNSTPLHQTFWHRWSALVKEGAFERLAQALPTLELPDQRKAELSAVCKMAASHKKSEDKKVAKSVENAPPKIRR